MCCSNIITQHKENSEQEVRTYLHQLSVNFSEFPLKQLVLVILFPQHQLSLINFFLSFFCTLFPARNVPLLLVQLLVGFIQLKS